ncbi:hypothetical protein FDECE_2581 [Fusarium decemcellulare]|nr:hypothetical protein FDECE_2581 [Fusarium decemcellulare]
MYLTKILLTVAIAAFGATKIAAVEHGDVTAYNGGEIKWQQLGKGMWTGIPVDEWDESIHKRSDVDYGLDKYALGLDQSMRHDARSLELQSRNLRTTCQAIAACATGYEDIELAGVLDATINAIEAAAGAVGTIWDLLNEKPFLTTIFGGTTATVVGIKLEKSLWPPPAAECSTASTDKDLLSSAISTGLSANPGASSISVDVNGPETGWTATMSVTKSPDPPVTMVGQCFKG